MLGMIEINLLPQEYRVQERTPMGFILTVVIGICVFGSIVIYGFNLRNQLSAEVDRNRELTQKKADAQAIADKVDKTQQEIDKAKKRLNTIIEISQTKIVWSLKLVQFGKVLAEYPSFWIDRISLERGGGGGNGLLSVNFYALGDDLANVARFRERFKNDTNFWYHFEKLDCPTETKLKDGGPLKEYGSYAGNVVRFAVTMPVR